MSIYWLLFRLMQHPVHAQPATWKLLKMKVTGHNILAVLRTTKLHDSVHCLFTQLIKRNGKDVELIISGKSAIVSVLKLSIFILFHSFFMFPGTHICMHRLVPGHKLAPQFCAHINQTHSYVAQLPPTVQSGPYGSYSPPPCTRSCPAALIVWLYLGRLN